MFIDLYISLKQVPYDQAAEVFDIMRAFKHRSTILDDVIDFIEHDPVKPLIAPAVNSSQGKTHSYRHTKPNLFNNNTNYNDNAATTPVYEKTSQSSGDPTTTTTKRSSEIKTKKKQHSNDQTKRANKVE